MTHAWLIPLSAIVGCALTWLIWRAVTARNICDIPNERSMHTRPVAIGAGWAIIGSLIICWPLATDVTAAQSMLLLTSTLILAAVSWQDDLKPLPPQMRLVLQAGIITLCLTSFPPGATLLGGALPLWADRLLTGFGWLWLVNLYNFMDGIDELAGMETVTIAGGYVLLAGSTGAPDDLTCLAAILAGAAIGFLVWNRHPARIILGDVGSVPLGFMLGWLMLDLAMRGHPTAAVILFMYHLTDATFTLLKRVLTVPEPWRPHRQHFYQRAVLGGLSAPQVVRRIGALNIVLVGLALLSASRPWLATTCAGIATCGLMVHLARAGHVAKASAPLVEPAIATGNGQIPHTAVAAGADRDIQTSTSHQTAA